MSLSLAYDIARSGLSATGTATSVVSRNVQNVGDPGSARKFANIATGIGGGVYVAGIDNAIDNALLDHVLEYGAEFEELGAVVDALDRLQDVFGDPALGRGPAAMLAELQDSLQVAASTPGDELLLQVAVARAGDVVRSLNEGDAIVAEVRQAADDGIREAAGQLTSLLDRFGRVNGEVVNGTIANRDVTDHVDERNAILREISELVGVRANMRGDNDMVLFAANGATLFERVPRQVTLLAAGPLVPGQPGALMAIDGVPLALEDAARLGGRIGGLMRVRDDYAITLGRQIDETARALVEAFAESDQSATPVQPDLPGLFTSVLGTIPAPGVIADGFAGLLRLNPNVDPAQGGDVTRLRDGGISTTLDPSYVYNQSGALGYSDRLRALVGVVGQARSFAVEAGLSPTSSLLGFAAESAGWLAEARRVEGDSHADMQIVGQRALVAWQDRVGINLDDELTELIALERSYQASSRMISTVNSMFDALLGATG